MAIVKEKHSVSLDAANLIKVETLLPDIYQNIGSVVGIFKPTIFYNPLLRLSVNELRRNGVVQKITVRTETGKSHVVICNTSYLSTALPGLVGKTIPEQIGTEVVFKKITKASIPRRRDRF
jgi:hypothetical protein